ncbi:CbiQ family ECF transporter T component [Georgenia daeguensis]|uniref:CbiQ family ECF transporter T component n=1 Tax=Georgenia daeguensis TaxID=908355 RepID=A0ABP8ENT1_9MICO
MTTTRAATTRASAAPRVAAATRGRLHPLGWWAWAGGVAVALTRTTNPVVVVLLAVAVVLVVAVHRDGSPWARAFGAYLVLGGVVITVRLFFYVLVGVDDASPVVVDLPGVPLPEWAVGVELLGPVHLSGLLAALYGGLRLAALIVAFGAANALANPKRALRCLPASLHHLGTAVVIAVTVTPQLASAVGRVRRAQRLRGLDARGPRAAAARLLPVLQDALDHALALAASMDSRGYARTTTPGGDRRVGVALVVALLAAVLGTYGLLDGSMPDWSGPTLLAVGAAVAVLASVLAGRRVHRTRYRPDPWRGEEWVVAGCGVLAAACVVAGAALEPTAMTAPVSPPAWPALPLAGALAALAAATPAVLRPRSVR